MKPQQLTDLGKGGGEGVKYVGVETSAWTLRLRGQRRGGLALLTEDIDDALYHRQYW